jgi:predicted alternative tryptophan synthase beta-subunit
LPLIQLYQKTGAEFRKEKEKGSGCLTQAARPLITSKPVSSYFFCSVMGQSAGGLLQHGLAPMAGCLSLQGLLSAPGPPFEQQQSLSWAGTLSQQDGLSQ